ncbi:hypothetical protein CC86DRAFT_280079 [Ophiobolus disseminans]|uniref:SnoaL-like domain-containing protein n=1 Tax=Ophiobolus disseminans TaxID=1469910 RepID=A0A6A7AGN6_9PLEO|nr:hypothetical protein CC86DRAFT_280079 [Ophiobolus disseminans]
MSATKQSLGQWIETLNDTLFIQPNDELALKAINEDVDSSLITKHLLTSHHRINDNTYTYDQFKPGVQYARSTTTSTQDVFDIILEWENPEKGGGVVAVLSKWTIKDKASGEETKKTNVIVWEVKVVDGKRKLVGQTEVETVD